MKRRYGLMKFLAQTILLAGLISSLFFSTQVVAEAWIDHSETEPLPVFYLSSGFSKGSTVDPLTVHYGDEIWRTEARLIYTNMAYNKAIYSYAQPNANNIATDASIFYIDQAYGPAIYSYPFTAEKGSVYLEELKLIEE